MAEIKVGKPDIAIDATSHLKGVEEGNAPKKQSGLHEDGTVDARFSTGINPKRHDPLADGMPNLPPG
jgi:hypothetical protein